MAERPRRRIELYVSDQDRATLDALPADVSRSELLRLGLAAFLDRRQGCQHRRCRCEDCGARVAGRVAGSPKKVAASRAG